MRLSVFGLALALALAAGEHVSAHPHQPLVVKINPDDRTELLQRDLGSGATSVLYRTSGAPISEVLVSPYYSRVALIETAPSDSGVPVNRLVVVDDNGALLRTVDADVRRMVFSPDGRRLACISGSFYPGGIGFRPQRTFIVDLETDAAPEVLEGLERAHDLHWLATDGENSLYFKVLFEGEDRVLRWNVSKRSLEETDLDGIRFSPDGEYLLRKPYEVVEVGDCAPGSPDDSCLRVTARQTGSDLLWLAAQEGTAHGWVYGRGHHLLLIERDPQTETVVERRGEQELAAELVSGYRPARGLVYELGTDKPPVEVVGIIGGEGSAGDWVTGVRGVIVQPPDSSGSGSGTGRILEVCEQLPCPDQDTGTSVGTGTGELGTPSGGSTGLPAPATESLEPTAGAEFEYANPRFRWAEVAGASSYRLDVCGDELCGDRVGGAESVEATAWRSGGLPIGELYWRVAPVEVSDDGVAAVGEFTPPLRFFVRSDRLDLEPPTPSIAARPGVGKRMVKGASQLYAPDVAIVVGVDDDLSGVDWWQAEIDGKTVEAPQVETDTALRGPWSNGAHQIDVRAEDRAGNVSTSTSVRFTVDAEPPKLILQFVTPETLIGRRGGGLGRSHPSSRDFEWLDLTDRSQVGVTTVFFDNPGRSLRADRRPETSEGGFVVRSVWPELVLAVRGDWPFNDELRQQAAGERLLWIAAVDDGSGVAAVELRAITAGSERKLEITARDRVGNVSPPVSLEIFP